MTTIQDIIDHAYETRWRFQKDGERTRKRAMSWGSTWSDAMDVGRREVAEFVEEGRACGNSPATVNRALAALSCAFKVAYDDGLIDGPGPRFPRLPEDGARDRVPTRDEVARMLRALRNRPDNPYDGLVRRWVVSQHVARATRLMYRTGLRRGEVLGLTYDDCWHPDSFEPKIRLRVTKNGLDRVVPVPASCAAWRSRNPGGMFRMSNERPFAISESTFSALWREAREAAGLGDWFVPHCLRHARATELVRSGVHVAIVAKILGHQDWKTTQRYTHPNTDDLRAAIESRPHTQRP